MSNVFFFLLFKCFIELICLFRLWTCRKVWPVLAIYDVTVQLQSRLYTRDLPWMFQSCLTVFLPEPLPHLVFITLISGISIHPGKQFQNLRIIFNLISHMQLVIKSCLPYILNISQTYTSLHPYPISFGL